MIQLFRQQSDDAQQIVIRQRIKTMISSNRLINLIERFAHGHHHPVFSFGAMASVRED
ncbi:MAG: hypothetical protein U0X75_17790 [Acidobacteriota bacterium]